MYKKVALLLFVCLSSIASAQQADLAVFKDGPPSVTRGSTVTYTVTLTNFGPSAALNVVLTDVLVGDATFVSVTPSAGCTGATCTIASLASGTTVVYDFTFQTDPDATGSLEDTASVTSATTDPNGNNNSAPFSTTVVPSADLSVTKSGPELAAAGSDVAYTVTIANLGPDDATDVVLSDPIPPGMTFVSATQENGPTFACIEATCTIDPLAAGTSATFTFVFQIDPQAAPATTFTNIATASSETLDPNEENDAGVAATSTPAAAQADLSLAKSGPSFAPEDSDVVFTITLTNAGPGAATNVSLTDTLPGTMTFVSLGQSDLSLNCTTPAVGAGGTITCTAASFPAGASTTLTLTAHVPPQTPSGTEYTNTAVVTSDADPNEENDVATFAVVISSVDASVDKSGPATADAGTNVSYGLIVTNDGPDPATVTLTDDLPAGTTFVSITRDTGPSAVCAHEAGTVVCTTLLGPAQTITFTLVVNAGTSPSITNTATVTTEGFDTDPLNDTDSVTTTLTPRADLSVAKSGPATIVAGQNITYSITVTNNGPSAAANVSLTDVITPNAQLVGVTQTSGPAFNCTLATCTAAVMAAGTTATFNYTYTVLPDAAGTVDDTATVSTTTNDPASGNNSAPFSSTVTTSADLAVGKTAPIVAASGTDVTYEITVTNLGSSNATNVTMTDVLPPSTTFVSLNQSGSPFNCTTGQTMTCTAATLPALSSTVFTVVAHVAAGATGTIENTATVAASTPDPNPLNNSVSIVTGLNPGATDLAIAKSANGTSFPAGGSVTYTIVVTNNGPAVAFGTTVSDVLPADTMLESALSTQGSCVAGPTVVCSLGTLAPAATATITLVVRLPRYASSVTNTATVTAANAETSPANNASTNALAVTAEIPTLSQWALLLLVAFLAVMAITTMRA